MSTRRFPVTFVPAGVTVWARDGATVLDAARSAGILIPSPCGGRGVCGKCGVRVLEGSMPPPDRTEIAGLKLAPPNVRLACLLRGAGPMTVRPVVAMGSTSSSALESAGSEEPLRAALDLGTTTVEAVIFSLRSGRELGRASVPNAQIAYGSDLITRVSADEAGQGEALAVAVRASARDALMAACGRAGACFSQVERIVAAGNAVVASTFLGMPLTGFSAHPFEAPFDRVARVSAIALLGDGFAQDTHIDVLPPIASFVGGDVTAGLLAAGLLDPEGPALYVDVGTNAEIAFVRPAEVIVASAPAGPAFEGMGITSGGPAATGGIRAVSFTDGGLVCDVIGGGVGEWLTGSGLASAISVLRSSGHLAADGRLSEEGPIAGSFARLDGVLAVRIAGTDDRPVWLSQTDVRAFQTAKTAIASGIAAVLHAARAKPKGIRRLVIAGAFGAALTVNDLSGLGLIPHELAGRVEYAGNASLVGAAMMAGDESLLASALAVVAEARSVELASDPVFAARFVERLALEPHTL